MRSMDKRRLTNMTVDELSDLHRSILVILTSKLETQKAELDERLRRLHANASLAQAIEPSRRSYRGISPKFRNPAQPDQTWSGRGKKPRWVTELLNAGMRTRDFQIGETNHSAA